MYYKTYADGTKAYGKVNNDEESRRLQRAIDDFHNWNLQLPVDKCVVVHCSRRDQKHEHFIEVNR